MAFRVRRGSSDRMEFREARASRGLPEPRG